MKAFKRFFVLFLTASLVTGCLYSTGWAGDDNWAKNDPVGQGWSAVDLLVARVCGVAVGIAGSAVFVAALPFTIPSGGVHDAADMFIIKPFQFSFIREFPDDNI
jgi:hypothetical protein